MGRTILFYGGGVVDRGWVGFTLELDIFFGRNKDFLFPPEFTLFFSHFLV